MTFQSGVKAPPSTFLLKTTLSVFLRSCLITTGVLRSFELCSFTGSAVNGLDFPRVNLDNAQRSARHLWHFAERSDGLEPGWLCGSLSPNTDRPFAAADAKKFTKVKCCLTACSIIREKKKILFWTATAQTLCLHWRTLSSEHRAF